MDKEPWFPRVANSLAHFAGRASTFVGAIALVVLWAALGPVFHYSDTWQLVINTSTTIVTFLMVFLIQNTQNRDTAAIQAKLDELIRAAAGADNALIDLERLDEKEIDKVRAPYEELAQEARDEAGNATVQAGNARAEARQAHQKAELARQEAGEAREKAEQAQ